MLILWSVFVFLAHSDGVPTVRAQDNRANNSLTVFLANETSRDGGSVSQPVAPPVDHKGRPNCRAPTVCFQDEADQIAYPTQLIADAVAIIRSRQTETESDSIVEQDTNTTLTSLIEQHRDIHQDENPFSQRNVSKNGVQKKGNRHQSDVREWPACKAANFHFPIKAALTERGQWKYIVNNENYMQVVTGSICTEEGSGCDAFRFSLTIRSTCRQNYVKYSLVALDPENKEPLEEKFLIPSACVCTLKWAIT